MDQATIFPLVSFLVFMAGAWFMLSLISNRNTSQAEERLDRLGRPKSLAEIELDDERSRDRFSGMKDAVSTLARIRLQNVRIGTQDLRIAAITLAHDATLLTRNGVDFAKVPELRFENWLD